MQNGRVLTLSPTKCFSQPLHELENQYLVLVTYLVLYRRFKTCLRNFRHLRNDETTVMVCLPSLVIFVYAHPLWLSKTCFFFNSKKQSSVLAYSAWEILAIVLVTNCHTGETNFVQGEFEKILWLTTQRSGTRKLQIQISCTVEWKDERLFIKVKCYVMLPFLRRSHNIV